MRISWLVVSIAACSPPREPRARPPQRIHVETFAELAVGPGNIATTPDGRVFVSLHQFYDPEHAVVELRGGGIVAFPDEAHAKAAALDSVLGIRADSRGVVWMLDNAMRGRGGTRKIVAWNPTLNALDRTIDLASVTPPDAFLNDLAVDRTSEAVYVADPAGGANAALIVVDLVTGTARRVLEGHVSVVPDPQRDLVIDGQPVQIKLPDGKPIRPHIGVNPIALDTSDEWLYFGPMHAAMLYRVRTRDLRDAALTPGALAARVEAYAERPITDGISIDQAGNIYLGDLANNAIGMIDAGRHYRQLASGPDMSWIDAFSFGADGYYYVVANQLHHSAFLNAGNNTTKPPYRILRFRPFAPGRVGR